MMEYLVAIFKMIEMIKDFVISKFGITALIFFFIGWFLRGLLGKLNPLSLIKTLILIVIFVILIGALIMTWTGSLPNPFVGFSENFNNVGGFISNNTLNVSNVSVNVSA